ncbi:MAG: ABC transporter permease [bacterium]|nr:ABC transporter permease [bacterium]
MSLWHIAWSYLWNRKFTTVLTIVSVALGVGLISTVLTLRHETQRRFEEEGQTFDMVVGAKGNPLQLVLSAVYFLDAPTGNITLADLERMREEEDIVRETVVDENGKEVEVVGAFPIGLGDTYRGHRVVGTERALLEKTTWDAFNRTYPYGLSEGRLFDKPFEAVVGYAVAQSTGLELGQKFITTHGIGAAAGMGHEHKHDPYVVVGVMEQSGTPNDRAIFCDLESVWQVHQHDPIGEAEGDEDEAHAEDHDGHDHAEGEACEHADHDHGKEVTAILVKLPTPALRPTFKDYVNDNYNAMATVPVNEIQKLFNQLLGTAKAVLLAIGYLVMVISSISIMIGLYMAILQRKRDLAVMRALGATKGEIFGSVIIEAFWVTVLGLIAGWFCGTLTCWGLSHYLVDKVGFHVNPLNFDEELVRTLVSAYSVIILMGLFAGILPAWQAYRSDVARDLAEL